MIYLIGSLKNSKIPAIANKLREAGFEVFDQWFCPGPEADDYWQKYTKQRGQTFIEALNDAHAKHVFAFDKTWLDRADIAILALPAGKSGHLELGYCIGRGKPSYILMEGEPERFDVMYKFAWGVFTDIESLIAELKVPNCQACNINDPDMTFIPATDQGHCLKCGRKI